jgi:hypothetical protein
MNYKNKDMLYKIENMEIKYWISVLQMPRNPLNKYKLTRCYKTKT